MVVFRAGGAYTSPNWYPSKHETHNQVPTWNYQVVHAYGRVTIHNDERYVRSVIGHLTRTHKATQERPWKMSDAPKDYMDALVKAIAGIEFEVTRYQGKSKLSQNKDVRDLRGAANGVMEQGNTLIGNAMHDHADAKERG